MGQHDEIEQAEPLDAPPGQPDEEALPEPPLAEEEDRLFRSHFLHVNTLADRTYDDVRPAYALGLGAADDLRFAGRGFDEVETDLERDWLNVRSPALGTAWQAVRAYAREAFERGRQIGRVGGDELLGGSPSHQRASFSDPIAGGIDPTAPDGPEAAPGR